MGQDANLPSTGLILMLGGQRQAIGYLATAAGMALPWQSSSSRLSMWELGNSASHLTPFLRVLVAVRSRSRRDQVVGPRYLPESRAGSWLAHCLQRS